MPAAEERVSFDDEPLIVVDDADRVLGYGTKAEVHRGAGILHRAFSVFLFNRRGEVLLQRRSALKPLWPRYWSNSCCSHPRRGETYEDAVRRRLAEELGVAAETELCFRFRYHASFGSKGSERELCSVFIGSVDGPLAINRSEIAECTWMPAGDLEKQLADAPDLFTPWLKLEWPRVARYARS